MGETAARVDAIVPRATAKLHYDTVYLSRREKDGRDKLRSVVS